MTAPTILVTGGTGFLGQSVIPDLLRDFPGRIISVSRTPLAAVGITLPEPHVEVLADLRDHQAWRWALAEADYVFWMAALRDHGASAQQAERDNVDPLRAALDDLRGRAGFRRFVFASTISALDQPPHPHRPRRLTDRSPAHPMTPYGHSKLMSERLLEAGGVPYTALRLPFLYGPGFRRGSFLDFYRTVARSPALSAMRFTANLSLLHTGDVAAVLLRILHGDQQAADASPYVLSDGVTYEVDDLISLVAEVHGHRRPPIRAPASLGRLASAVALRSRRVTRAGPVARGRLALLGSYWSHAAFSRDFFVVDATRFHTAYPGLTFTPVEVAMARSFPDRAAARRG